MPPRLSCGHTTAASPSGTFVGGRIEVAEKRQSGVTHRDGACVGKPGELGMACMATAIIFLISALCGVCGAGIVVAIALVAWPESKTQTEV